MRVPFRSGKMSLAVLAGAGLVSMAGAVMLFLVVQAQVDGGIRFWPFLVYALLGWGVLTTALLVARSQIADRERELARLADELTSNPALGRARSDESDRVERSLHRMAERLASAEADLQDARRVGQALLQVGNHYALMCTLEGRVTDANAALLARLGISGEQLQHRGDAVMGMLRLRPLLKMASRSLAEDASISGIEHAIESGGEIRPVDVSLRTMRLREGPVVVIVMTDRAHEAQLERQIDQFTDAVELMVDQRVARITAGRNSMESILAQSGVALFQFDHAGDTEKLNPAAELLTGRTKFTLQSFTDVAHSLARDADVARSLGRWFFADVQIPRKEFVHTAHGRTEMLLLSGAELLGAEAGRRLLVAVPMPIGDEAGSESPEALLRRLAVLAGDLDPSTFTPGARAFVGVVREAIRRLEISTSVAGDGLPMQSEPVSP